MGIPAHRAEMHSHRSRCTATLAEMHNHPLLCSCRERTLGARSLGLTESGSLAGPGPKLTTCLGPSMVRGRRPLACPKGPTRGQRESVPGGADSLPSSSAELPSPLAALSQVLRLLVHAMGLAFPLVALASRGWEPLLLPQFTISTLFFFSF